MMAVASVVGDSIHRKPLMRTVFNASQITLALAVAVTLLDLFGEDDRLSSGAPLDLRWFVVAFMAATALFVVNATLTCIALALHEGTSINRMLRRGLHLNISTDGALVALSPIFAVVAQRSLLLLPLIVATAGFVYRSTRSALDNEHEANHDELTTLLNRRAFMARLTDELSRREPSRCCALVLIDLDGFKQINDRLGHSVGDSVLRELGIRLGGRQRQGEIAARIGGDEFALLMTNVASPDGRVGSSGAAARRDPRTARQRRLPARDRSQRRRVGVAGRRRRRRHPDPGRRPGDVRRQAVRQLGPGVAKRRRRRARSAG